MPREVHQLACSLLLPLLLLLGIGRAEAQLVLEETRELDFDRPESWAMKYFASVNLLTGLGVPRARKSGSVDLDLELLFVPGLSEDQRRVGFGGTKVEDLNRLPVLVRPRLDVGLPHKLTLTLSWVPPVEIRGVEPNLWALALGRPVLERERWRLGLRLFAQYATLTGDLTCPAAEVAAGDDRVGNPFGCEEPSRDEMTLRTASLEISVGFRPGTDSRWEPYVAAAVNTMDLDFQVDALFSGIRDRTLLLTEGETFYLTAGTTLSVNKWFNGGLELFFTPLDVIRPPETLSRNDDLWNVRVIGRFTLR